jgi:hypothetical protein
MNKLGFFGTSLRLKKFAKPKKAGKNSFSKKRSKGAPVLEQPIVTLASSVRCHLCGHPVDAKRMHPHMVRFHAATFRSAAV